VKVSTEYANRRSPAETPGRGVSGWVNEVTMGPLCQSQRLAPIFSALDTPHPMPGEWGVNSSQYCGLIFTSPWPDPEAMPGYYPTDYQPFGAPHAPTENRPFMAALRRLAGRLLDPKEHVLPRGLAPGRALEVGCGSGRISFTAQKGKRL
jgi:hypothetical protein